MRKGTLWAQLDTQGGWVSASGVCLLESLVQGSVLWGCEGRPAVRRGLSSSPGSVFCLGGCQAEAPSCWAD